MEKATPAFNSFLKELIYKFKYFSKRRKLNANGSFYYDDKRLAEEIGVNSKTIMRAKRYWSERGVIKFNAGKFRGKATDYWILKMPVSLSPFSWSDKSDKRSFMADKLSVRGCQNVIPNQQISFNNHIYVTKSHFDEIYQINSKDFQLTKDQLLSEGYTEFQIEEAYRKNGQKSPNTS